MSAKCLKKSKALIQRSMMSRNRRWRPQMEVLESRLLLSVSFNPAPGALPAGTVNVPYGPQTITTDGTSPVDVEVSNIQGAIPGLTIPISNTDTLTISGTPAATGTVTFHVEATDADLNVIDGDYSITINPPPEVGTVTTLAPLVQTVNYGTMATFTIEVTALGGSNAPTGNVEIFNGGNDLGAASFSFVNPFSTTARYTFTTTSRLSAGSYHNIQAVYTPDSDAFTGSRSNLANLFVQQAPLTVSGITASDKVYNGSAAATLNVGGAQLNGVFTGDQVTLDTSGAMGAFPSADVGTNLVVNVSGLQIGGGSASNYILTQPTTTASITQAAANITITGTAVVGDGSPHPAIGMASGVESTPANLTPLLHLSYSTDGGHTFSSNAPVAPGTYEVYYTFDGNTDYQAVSTPTDSHQEVVIAGPGATQAGGVLFLVGGNTNDQVTVAPGTGSNVVVNANLAGIHVNNKSFSGVTSLVIVAGNGNDSINIDNHLTLPAVITLGNGNDIVTAGNGNITLMAGKGNDNVTLGNGSDTVVLGNGNDNIKLGDGQRNVVVAGSGTNNIVAGNGNNLIVGGLGHENIQVGNGQNILIDGSVSGTPAALLQALNDWVLTGDTSANKSAIKLLLGTIVNNTTSANKLKSGTGVDWFLATFAKDQISAAGTEVLN